MGNIWNLIRPGQGGRKADSSVNTNSDVAFDLPITFSSLFFAVPGFASGYIGINPRIKGASTSKITVVYEYSSSVLIYCSWVVAIGK